MTVDPNIVAVFGPPPEGLNLSESRVRENDASVIAMLALGTILVLLRFAARIIQRSRLLQDDWVVILALVFVAGTVGMSIAGGVFGAGKHVWSLKVQDVIDIYKILYIYTFVYAAACASTKISILLFYTRVFTARDPIFKKCLIFGYFLSFSYPIIVWATMGNCCRSITFYWMQFSGAIGNCIDVKKFFLALGIINMLNDVFILVIPIPQILKLQMSPKKKAAISGIMLLGGFVCVASIVRIWYLSEFMKSIDVTWLMGPVFIWSAIEPSIGIVSACLPHMGPLQKLTRKKLSEMSNSYGSGGGRHGKGSSSVPPWRYAHTNSHGGTEASAGRDGTLVTYGGARFNFGGDRRVKLGSAEDEIGLTNRVTTGEEELVSNSKAIMVQSTFETTHQRQMD